MRRPWIKIETATPDKPEICAIATRLRIDTDSVVGKLVRLWSWAEVNRVDGNDIGVTKEFIDKLVGRKGFAEALEAAGWLIALGESLQFANFDRHNGNASKIRGQTAKRVERHRQTKSNPARGAFRESAAEGQAMHPPPLPDNNAVSDVNKSCESLKENKISLEFHSSSTATDELETPAQNNASEVASFEHEASLPPAGPTPEEAAEEGESVGKLPRLSKRSARLPADEDQPMLF